MLSLLCPLPAVQEERQRGKDRNENEVESTSSANEDMPVEKILEAELAVEPKTETYIDANMGLTPSSVRHLSPCPQSYPGHSGQKGWLMGQQDWPSWNTAASLGQRGAILQEKK